MTTSRRAILGAGVGMAAGALLGAGGAVAIGQVTREPHEREPFFGPHQSGVMTAPHAHTVLIAFNIEQRNLLPKLLRLWTADAALLTQGQPALADPAPDLAQRPSRLTVTIGLGEPALPEFAVDRLEQTWSGGDLLLQLCADDETSLAHARRQLLKDAAPFATIRWIQNGFLSAADVAQGRTPRNLMGQIDGTVQPDETAVWRSDGSTLMVVRRIRLELDTWDRLSPSNQEKVVGRHLSTGAPIGKVREFEDPDFDATDHHGLLIPPDAHIRLARSSNVTIHRRGFNYTQGAESGLIFISHQASIDQFITMQRALEKSDALNAWTTPIGSAVFHILPGCEPGGWIGESVLG